MVSRIYEEPGALYLDLVRYLCVGRVNCVYVAVGCMSSRLKTPLCRVSTPACTGILQAIAKETPSW